MEQKKLTISVGTSAYNEEQNIAKMLESVCNQKEKTIRIREIIVVSDGSLDKTVKAAKKIKDERIKIFDDRKRKGLSSRFNELLNKFNGDILVIVDSDMLMKDKLTVEKMASYFAKDPSTALVCGNTEPLPAKTFLEGAINNYILVRESLGKEYSFGNTAYGAHAFLAFSRKFAKSLSIPKNILNPDAYSYFTCKSKGYQTIFAKDAVALYRSPQSINDHINQATRHIIGGSQLKKYFEEELVDAGFTIPKPILTKLMFLQLKKNPVGYIVLKILNFYCQYLSIRNKNFDPKWTTIKSSKKLLLI